MNDVNCPYCNHGQEINHDDGYGYEEDVLHEQECTECEKTFTFLTSISFDYSAHKADCLNGGDHKYKPTMTYPKSRTRMRCTDCDHKREPTQAEWQEIYWGAEDGNP